MDETTRAEIEKLHGRINDVKDRVTVLEAQTPHIKEALGRIEKSVDRLNGHIVKAIWVILILFIGVVFKFTVAGGWSIPGV
ncbi:hypothetical protein HB779_17330 [Phyllobacterium sp. 628]|uniref:hypothetical protein n=1 Tax=Phyllobacterium sp. 628 TaxID=2718938 RepID=UPI0016625DA1|nr:hypothetical protein [Phyllobacterium sp. 628]QND53453.1 hypothetical protein HB779_17330 [Phyllobacterium sp. 628]